MLSSDHSAFLSRLPVPRVHPGLLVAALLAAFALGCTPKIGDSCTTSTNCSASGDRLCDITEPGGYCTIFNCEPGSCPDGSVCINFGTQLSSVDGCSLSNSNSPYQRSFCMASCAVPSDCRGGYTCADINGPLGDAVGAVVADDTGTHQVCMATALGVAPGSNTLAGVCNGNPDAGPPASNTASGGSSGSDAGGGSGAAGAAGSNEAGAGG